LVKISKHSAALRFLIPSSSGFSPPICFEQRSVSHRFFPKKNKKATDKVALISERYLAGGLSCLLKASLV
jgi:hypothetical protein